MTQSPASYISAIAFGIAIGLIGCVSGQRLLNNHNTVQCANKNATHKLVTYSSYLGDAKYCMNKRAFHYGPAH